jgi:hypothetical protein
MSLNKGCCRGGVAAARRDSSGRALVLLGALVSFVMANVLFAGAPRSWIQHALKTAPRGKLPMRGKLPVFGDHVHAIAPNLDYYGSV